MSRMCSEPSGALHTLMSALFVCLLATSTSSAETARFPDHWIDGTTPSEPAFQVHSFSKGTWIARQSLSSHFEAPFLFVLEGEREALLLDTGAPADVSVREMVDGLIGDLPLVVTHTHAHGDHVAGDGQFLGRPNTRIVGHSSQEVASFFGIDSWPTGLAVFDLGERELTVIPIPGHEPSSIAIFDAMTGLLLTGDTFYPGRLYVSDADEYRASIDRLVRFTGNREIAWILGTHIEMSRQPGVDFPQGAPQHPNERELQLTRDHLLELQASLESMPGRMERAVRDHFIVVPIQRAE